MQEERISGPLVSSCLALASPLGYIVRPSRNHLEGDFPACRPLPVLAAFLHAFQIHLNGHMNKMIKLVVIAQSWIISAHGVEHL